MESPNLIIEFLNYSAIFFGLIGKIPQIQVLYRTKSTAGLSLKSTIMELLAFLIISTYCAKQGYGLKSYLEIVSAVIQTLIFLLMTLYYEGTLTMTNNALVFGLLNLFYAFYLGYPHEQTLDYLVAGVSVFLSSSKLLQLKTLWSTRNSENISIPRWLIASYMSFARILTNILGVVDKALLFNAALAFILNIAIVVLSYSFRQKEGGTKSQGNVQRSKKSN